MPEAGQKFMVSVKVVGPVQDRPDYFHCVTSDYPEKSDSIILHRRELFDEWDGSIG